MLFSFSTIALLPDFVSGATGVLITIIVSFLVITMISSYYRFQHIIEQAETIQPEKMGATPLDILRVQLARYLAGCARKNISFLQLFIRVEGDVVTMGSPCVQHVRKHIRCDDITGIYNDQTIVVLMEAEPEDALSIAERIAATLAFVVPAEHIRIGISSYPDHGLSGKELISIAEDGLEETTLENPIFMQEIIDPDADEEGEEDDEGEVDDEVHQPEAKIARHWKPHRKNAMLDPLTGVLKPAVISAYMQRKMSDLRRSKKKAALFCMGINNMEHIKRFHGDDAASDMLVGVSHVIQKNFRVTDLIGRHEEYAFLVLAQASLSEAEVIGKRISNLVQHNQVISGGKKIKTTLTLGVATYPEHGKNLHLLYQSGQKVLDYSRDNDIRAYAVYNPEVHDVMPSKPMKSIKSIQSK